MYSWYEVSWNGSRELVRAKSAEQAKKRWCNFNGYLSELPGMQAEKISDDEEPPAGYYYIIR